MTCQFRKSRAGTSLGAITPWVFAIACVAMSGRIALADPPSISNLATKTALSSAESERIATYGKEWGERLLQIAHGEETDDDVRRVRGKLIEPLQIGNTSAVFRNAYDTALSAPLGEVLAAGDPITGVNALIITSELGTTSALATLIDNVGRRQPDRHLRLTAARGVRRLLESGRLTRPGGGGGAANTILGGARNLKIAATQEQDHLTLAHQLHAILAVAEFLSDSPEQSNAYQYLIESLKAATERKNSDDMGDLLVSLHSVIRKFRDTFIRITDQPLQNDVGSELGPCLHKMLDIARANWEAMRQDPTAAKDMGAVIQLCESFLQTVDRIVRGNAPAIATDFKSSWDRDDTTRFDKDLAAWGAILTRRPYRR